MIQSDAGEYKVIYENFNCMVMEVKATKEKMQSFVNEISHEFKTIFTACFFNVKINYNMTAYLPEHTNSTVVLDLMDAEFGEAVPNCNVMMQDVSILKVLEIYDSGYLSDSSVYHEVLASADTADIGHQVCNLGQYVHPVFYGQQPDLSGGKYSADGRGYLICSGFSFHEPELNLHASAQKDFMYLLKDIAKQNQIIFTTHSPYMLEEVEGNVPCIVCREGGSTIRVLEETDEETLIPIQGSKGK